MLSAQPTCTLPPATGAHAPVRFKVVLGGAIGSDPHSIQTWSGSAWHLLCAMREANVLEDAIGLKLPRWTDAALKVAHFSPSRQIWRTKFYLDPACRDALTHNAARALANSPASSFLQIGAFCNLPRAVGSKIPCFSYHDGNIVEAARSGYGLKGISARRIDAAIRYERELAHHVTAIFTSSEYLKKSFVEHFGVEDSRVFNVGAGVNFRTIPDAPSHKNYEDPEILFVGVDFERKGGPELLAAFRAVRDVVKNARLHIVGPYRMPYGADHPGIEFHGHLNKAVEPQQRKLHQLYENASIFVLPSKYEPFGVAPLEAMLYAIPCIVTNGWALCESVIDGLNGILVEQESVDSITAALLTLLRSPGKLAEMGQRGRERVLANYTWPSVVERMELAAQQMIARNP